MAPVPEGARKRKLPFVPNRGWQPASNLARSSNIWGERWLNNGRSPAARTISGTCIGPGKNSNGFLMDVYKNSLLRKIRSYQLGMGPLILKNLGFGCDK